MDCQLQLLPSFLMALNDHVYVKVWYLWLLKCFAPSKQNICEQRHLFCAQFDDDIVLGTLGKTLKINLLFAVFGSLGF